MSVNPIPSAMKKILLILFLFSIPLIQAQDGIIPFDSDQWSIANGEVTEYLGKTCFTGRASLNGIEFTNGTIEFDLAVTGERTYPGVYFRVQGPGEYEQFYIRPHRIWYDDVLQYAPAHKGASCWQLFHGEGCTAGYELASEQWVHFRMEVMDDQARIFINDDPEAALLISHLNHGISSGGIMINTFNVGMAYFANFSVIEQDIDDMPPKRKKDEPFGMLRDWEVSEIMNFADIDYEKYPADQGLDQLSWTAVKAETSGLVNLSKIYPRTYRTGDACFVRTKISASEDKVEQFSFGYSDVISVFLNGQIYFTGVSTYQSRNLSFLGILGLNDILYLPLKKGNNELLLMMGEGFGGWGFMFQGTDVMVDDRIEEAWHTEDVFSVPESVLYDPARDVLYVTNFDQFTRTTSGREQYISKLSPAGEILDLQYIDSLDNPLGMCIHNDKLYVAEKGGFSIADLKTAKVIDRVSIPEAMFPNDIEVDEKGRVYVSDSRKNVVWRIINSEVEIWLEGKDILDPNTIKIIDERLYVGNSGDQRLKAFDLETRDMEVIADFVPGFIDGIRQLPYSELLVSLWDGKLYLVSAEGEVNKLLDLKNEGTYIADFEYIHETGILYIPGFFTNKVIAYKINW